MRTVFYSWQSDLPNATNRGFIEDCLERAIDELHKDEKVRVFEPDRDTQGESGSPDIADTIFDKIDRCAAFVADVSFINGMEREQPKDGSELLPCDCTRLTPNPNVMCEWGRATKSVGIERIISVLNTATGKVEDLPFDLRKRKVETYELRKGEDKKEARKTLVGKLKGALKSVMALPDAQLDLQFVEHTTHGLLGRSIALEGTAIAIDFDKIPSYGRSDAGIFAGIQNAMTNQEYWRELANYVIYKHLFQPVTFRLKNTGSRLLQNVRLEAQIATPEDGGVFLIEKHMMPDRPSSQRQLGAIPRSVLGGVRSMHRHPGELSISKSGNDHRVEVKFLNLQAQAAVMSESFLIGSLRTGRVGINGFLFADELSAPTPVALEVDFTATRKEMTVGELIDSDKEEEEDVDE